MKGYEKTNYIIEMLWLATTDCRRVYKKDERYYIAVHNRIEDVTERRSEFMYCKGNFRK